MPVPFGGRGITAKASSRATRFDFHTPSLTSSSGPAIGRAGHCAPPRNIEAMGKLTCTATMCRSYPSPDSDGDVVASAASTEAETSPATERDSASCEPVSTNAQQQGNRRRKSHSPEAWEAVKADIARLYLEENRRLKVRSLGRPLL
ncbi:hypothetical protein NUW58_g9960 [Xylaria curta]|uniref:Uncharacterized protein n=1 Tax=Xylaria curta TaxID=42375 RepID=A0ACC1MTM9_9PEZI|nr:hypothetical protein NUW58_g9960 [Xylaria curta]